MKKSYIFVFFLILWLIFKAHLPTDPVFNIFCGPESAAQRFFLEDESSSYKGYSWAGQCWGELVDSVVWGHGEDNV